MIYKNLKGKKIILASQSPRRKDLMKELGLKFEVKTKEGIDESYPKTLKKEQIAVFLADHKAKSFEEEIHEDTIIITADTIVCINDEVLNKPKDYDEAVHMLDILSGHEHQVVTGVCIKSFSRTVTFSASTKVFFKHLTEEEIDYYIEKYKPYDKAGSYGIQEWIGYIGIEKIEGSYFNVMGLPVQKIYEELQKF